MNKLLNLTLALVLVVTVLSCKNSTEEPPLLNIGDVIRINDATTADLNDGVPYLCDSEGDIKSLLGDKVGLDVDFSQNVVILIKDVALQGVDKIDADMDYSDGVYDINVKVTMNYTNALDVWCIGVIAPKLDGDATRLNIEYSR
ncbi:MAG: hypothetical protein K2G47_08845 [Muribaculum sp.]|nr:hypothetical protein [Muribaculum sp.]